MQFMIRILQTTTSHMIFAVYDMILQTFTCTSHIIYAVYDSILQTFTSHMIYAV